MGKQTFSQALACVVHLAFLTVRRIQKHPILVQVVAHKCSGEMDQWTGSEPRWSVLSPGGGTSLMEGGDMEAGKCPSTLFAVRARDYAQLCIVVRKFVVLSSHLLSLWEADDDLQSCSQLRAQKTRTVDFQFSTVTPFVTSVMKHSSSVKQRLALLDTGITVAMPGQDGFVKVRPVCQCGGMQ